MKDLILQLFCLNVFFFSFLLFHLLLIIIAQAFKIAHLDYSDYFLVNIISFYFYSF